MKRLSAALSRARGIPVIDDLADFRAVVREVRSRDPAGLSPAALRARAAAGEGLDDLLPDCFALAAQASRERLGLEPFDEQLLAGVAMHRGYLAQVQTGEGKTLAAVFPASLQALAGRGVHVLTANDYLARRDARWMGPVYEALGLRAAFVNEGMGAAERRAAYRADVTYLTAREAGFDYLRDGLAYDPAAVVHRGFASVIVDEADFLLVDEARVPLVIAGAAPGDGVDVGRVDALAAALRQGTDYTVDREGRAVRLLAPAHARVEEAFDVPGIHDPAGAPVFARVHAALHARHLLQRDVDYVVKDGRIGLVDGFTGRVAERRQWPWGVQAALEAKEGLALQPEGTVYGSITTQDFLGLYERRAAMTATAVPSALELFDTYGLGIVVVPTVKPCRRVDEPDLLFATRREKNEALVAEVTRAHGRGTPVLVGTGSVRESQELAERLGREGVPCEVLNARNDEREAELIAAAGRRGAVTISTNMAGRGTDIRLGDDPVVLEGGGLRVLGTNRHESRRIDDQLRGRAGRQGEPGSSRFYVSLEDPLFERWGVAAFLPTGAPLDDPRVLREVDRAQSIIEGQNHSIRRTLRKYARLVELDRRTVRSLRDDALLRSTLPAALEVLEPPAEARAELCAAFLCLLDELWASHLLLAEEVREGIDLERFAGRDPGLEYIHRVGRAFEEGLAGIMDTLCEAYGRRASDPAALSLSRLGTARPASTWTYQVDDEIHGSFHLSLIGGSEIATALAAGPQFMISTGLAAGLAIRSAVRALLSLFRRERPGRTAGGPPAGDTDRRGAPTGR